MALETLPMRVSAQALVVRGHIPEVLQTIFEHAVLDWEAEEHGYQHTLQTLLCAINTTCRTWHVLACSSPWLWRNIFNMQVDVDELVFLKEAAYTTRHWLAPDHVPVYRLFIKRSAAVPLRLHGLGVLPLLSMVSQLNTTQLEKVEQLTIEWEDDWLDDVEPEKQAIVRHRLFHLSLPNLKTLIMDAGVTLEVQDFLAFISQHTGISSLVLSHVSFADTALHSRWEELPDNRPTFQILEDVQSAWSSFDDPDVLFSLISAPNLRSLWLFLTDVTETSDGALDVPPRGGRWGEWDSLQVLRVGGEILLSELESLALLAPHLQILELHQIRSYSEDEDELDGNSLVDMLTVREDEAPPYLPFLTTLRLDYTVRLNFPRASQAFGELIASRFASRTTSAILEIGLQPGRRGWDDEWFSRADAFAPDVSLVKWHPKHFWGYDLWGHP